MVLLERYLVQIGRYLPKKDKEDTLRELKSLLLENYDMLLETNEYTEDEALKKAITDFGYPREVAMKYKNEAPFFSKELEPLVFLIFKIVGITLPGAILLATMIEYFTSNQNTTTMGLLLEMAYTIPGIIQSLLSALAFIFIIFIFIDRKVDMKFKYEQEPFDPNLLPPIPADALKVSRFESMFAILGGVLFLYLFNLQPGLIAVYFDGNSVPLLNENFERILPLINVSVFISIGFNIAFFINGIRTKLSGTVEFFQAILSAITMFLLASGDIFNMTVLDGYGIGFLVKIFTVLLYIGGVGSIIGGLVKYIKIWFAEEEIIKIGSN